MFDGCFRRVALPALVTATGFFCLTVPAAEVAEPAAAILNFESSDAWHSVPLELPALMAEHGVTEEDLWCNQELRDDAWHLERTSLAQLDQGLRITGDKVKQGESAGRWRHLERFPTVAARLPQLDWSEFNRITVEVYADQATGDLITLGLRSDNARTPHRDFFTASFPVDFRGWKTVRLPFADFGTIGSPVGWQQIDAVYFFAKADGRHPNPYTALFLDAIRPERAEAQAAVTTDPEPVPRYRLKFQDQPMPVLNHGFPERAEPEDGAIAGADFITHQHYLRKERALYKYYPRFNPGYVSFDPANRAYVFSGDRVQFLDDDGDWQTVKLRPAIQRWAQEQGYYGIQNNWGGQGSDPYVRFDAGGDAYILVQYEPYDENGDFISWKLRGALLLHSRDDMKTFDAYKLPGRQATFEKLDGNNQDCLKRPPVILLGDYKYFGNADQDGYLLLPEKKGDGTLDLTHKVKYAENCLGVGYHSGDGNIALTANGKVFIAFGWCPRARAHRKLRDRLAADGKEWTVANLGDTPLGASLPDIPADHPGLELSYRYRIHRERTSEYPMAYSRNGVPTFVVAYDLETRTLSDPVYVGSGGGSIDAHNWPAITIDPQGFLHVIINGHHNPVVYTRSLQPFDHASGWTDPEYVFPGQCTPMLSYATLTCDRQGTLYTVHRSSTDVYNNRLSLYRRKAGQDWERERTLVAPDKRLYRVWYQRMSYSPAADKLFLTYFASGGLSFMPRDYYEFALFQRPELELRMPLRKRKNAGRESGKKAGVPGTPMGLHEDPYWDSWTVGSMFRPFPSEICTLVSDDGGETWRLAVTPDLDTAVK